MLWEGIHRSNVVRYPTLPATTIMCGLPPMATMNWLVYGSWLCRLAKEWHRAFLIWLAP